MENDEALGQLLDFISSHYIQPGGREGNKSFMPNQNSMSNLSTNSNLEEMKRALQMRQETSNMIVQHPHTMKYGVSNETFLGVQRQFNSATGQMSNDGGLSPVTASGTDYLLDAKNGSSFKGMLGYQMMIKSKLQGPVSQLNMSHMSRT